jgi:hypothetical protein
LLPINAQTNSDASSDGARGHRGDAPQQTFENGGWRAIGIDILSKRSVNRVRKISQWSNRLERAVVALRQTLLAATALTLVSGQTLVAGDYIVEISGTAGSAFGGTCLLLRAKNSTSYVTSGSVPGRFEFSGDIISCAIQPKIDSAHLQMVIKDAGGRVVGESTGSLPFGVVTAGGR